MVSGNLTLRDGVFSFIILNIVSYTINLQKYIASGLTWFLIIKISKEIDSMRQKLVSHYVQY